MSNTRNPLNLPQWHAIGREVALVRQLVGAGVTALGRANYADKIGEYYTAFFGLTVGFERLAKLIIVADYSISHGGEFPKQQHVSSFGHRLNELVTVVDDVSKKHNLNLRYNYPTEPISWRIIECLDSFADARKGRYANFASLGDPNLGQDEPVSKWWDSVAEMILDKHYYGQEAQRRVESRAEMVCMTMSKDSMVLHTSETGEPLKDIFSASVRTGQTEFVQGYGRFYTLLVARWLSHVFDEIATAATYTHNCDAFFGAWETLQTYTVEDRFLRDRKIWP